MTGSDHKSRGWGQAAARPGILKREAKRAEEGFPCRFQRWHHPAHTLTLDLQIPKLEDDTVVLFSITQVGVFCTAAPEN